MPLSKNDILAALRTVQDPDLGKDLVTLNMVRRAEATDSAVSVEIELTTPACPMKDRIRSDVEAAVRARAAELDATVDRVDVQFTAEVQPRPDGGDTGRPLASVRRIIAVGAGKGGVGKSTISTLLAVGLARFGARVGLLDGDIYGPSGSTMLGLSEQRPRMKSENIMRPFEAHGIKAMTIGRLVDPEKALIWRGPMAHGAFRQLAMQTDWGDLDYLVVDLPPGTGDVPLTLCQLLPLSGAVVVCTPQKVALDDARRAIAMFGQLGVRVLGIVENMSYFIGDDGKQYDIFGRGGAAALAETAGLPFLGGIPIHMSMRANADNGTPLDNWQGDPSLADSLDQLCQAVAQQVSIHAADDQFVQPTLSID